MSRPCGRQTPVAVALFFFQGVICQPLMPACSLIWVRHVVSSSQPSPGSWVLCQQYALRDAVSGKIRQQTCGMLEMWGAMSVGRFPCGLPVLTLTSQNHVISSFCDQLSLLWHTDHAAQTTGQLPHLARPNLVGPFLASCCHCCLFILGLSFNAQFCTTLVVGDSCSSLTALGSPAVVLRGRLAVCASPPNSVAWSCTGSFTETLCPKACHLCL